MRRRRTGGRPDSSETRIELDHKTVIPTHLPECVSVESEVLAAVGGGIAVCGARVRYGEGRSDTGDGHPGAEPGRVQCGVPEVADEAGEVARLTAECGGGLGKRRLVAHDCTRLKRSNATRQIPEWCSLVRRVDRALHVAHPVGNHAHVVTKILQRRLHVRDPAVRHEPERPARRFRESRIGDQHLRRAYR